MELSDIIEIRPFLGPDIKFNFTDFLIIFTDRDIIFHAKASSVQVQLRVLCP